MAQAVVALGVVALGLAYFLYTAPRLIMPTKVRLGTEMGYAIGMVMSPVKPLIFFGAIFLIVGHLV